MKHLGIIANLGKPEARDVLSRLQAKASSLDMQLYVTGAESSLLPGTTVVEIEKLSQVIDVLLVFGGDGSMLRGVRCLDGADIPLLGVNLGSLGFMTSIPEDQLETALDVLAAGNYRESVRTVAHCELFRDATSMGTYRALNDVVVSWGSSSRVVTIELAMDGESVCSYRCDGIILSTPTGSTGHSLSSGGPILHPESSEFVVSVICPHALSHRPLVVPDDRRLTLTVVDAVKHLLLSVDGQEEQTIEAGDRLEIRKSEHSVRFIHPPSYSYFSVLRQKLGWRGSSV